MEADIIDIYSEYIVKYGYKPRLPRQLIAFAKTINKSISYKNAKSIIQNGPTIDPLSNVDEKKHANADLCDGVILNPNYRIQIDRKMYERLKKLGLPMSWIVNKMIKDGCEAKLIETFGGKVAAKKIPTHNDKQIMPQNIRPTKNMKPFHWAKVSQHAHRPEIWKDAEKEFPKLCQQINFNEIAISFEKSKLTNVSYVTKKQKRYKVIDPKRAQNVMIGFGQLKMCEYDILDAMRKMDEKTLGANKLRQLLPYVPSDGELQIVRDYVKNGYNVNDLSKTGQLFVKMMDMVSIRQRLSLWIYKIEFLSILENVQRRLTQVSEAINVLMENERLRKVLYFVLIIGNYLNCGSNRGNAFGFSMEPTLHLLDGTKSAAKKTSLMSYLVETIHDIDPDALKWVQDTAILEITYKNNKIKQDVILNDLNAIKKDMASIWKFLRAQRQMTIRTESDWARIGATVSINRVASHLRKLSKLGQKAFFDGCETYTGLKHRTDGFAKVSVYFGDERKMDEKDTEDMFEKVMRLFARKQQSKVSEVEIFLEKTKQALVTLSQYFAFEEGKKWEEILSVFYLFRQQFMKAMKEMQMKREREERIRNQNEIRCQLAAKLAHQPKKGAVKTLNSDASDINPSKQNNKASAMYAAFKKRKRGSAHNKCIDV